MEDLLTSFAPWLARWGLEPDGEPFETAYSKSRLMPVRRHGAPAMLKLAADADRGARRDADGLVGGRRRGAGSGARGPGPAAGAAGGPRSLAEMANAGRDDEATRILCAVADQLHAPRAAPPPPDLVPLQTWFQALGSCRCDPRQPLGCSPRHSRGAFRQAPGSLCAAWRPAPRQCAGRGRTGMAGHRSEGALRRTGLRLRQHPVQPGRADGARSGPAGGAGRGHRRGRAAAAGPPAGLDTGPCGSLGRLV